MKVFYRLFFSLFVFFGTTGLFAQPQAEGYAYDLSYFFPQGNYSFDAAVPAPKDILGFEIGEQHADWGQVTAYMQALADASPRVTVREIGRTYQHRPFLEVVFSSTENQQKLDEIKAEHLKLSDVSVSDKLDLTAMPVVVNLIYSIHGNEPSGVNASLAIAYFLSAAQGKEIDDILTNVVVVMTPGANPDGINRFASWVNSSRSMTDVSDTNAREFAEPWPSSRTNHYWADCNRDWLMAQHPEGRNGIAQFLDWLPNVVADQHEQGSERFYYFSPGHPKRTHPLTSPLNQEMTAEISAYCAAELDKIGTLYFSKEGYDDFYYGKGAAYGDIHGAVCLLYEQPSIRGHLRQTGFGERSFAWAIRNQALASYATVLVAYHQKERLLEYQRSFFNTTKKDASKEAVKGYVFDSRGSKAVAYHFLENMARHQIDVYRLAKDYQSFKQTDAYVIPVDQKYRLMVKTIMEDCTDYLDSTFYDISTWTFPHAFNLHYMPVKSTAGLLGEQVVGNPFPEGEIVGGKSDYAYVFENVEFYTPKLINELLKRNLVVTVSGKPFLFKSDAVEKPMGYGTVLIPVQNQPLSSDELYGLVKQLAAECGVTVYAANTGLMADVDLGSPAYTPLKQPKVALLVGRTMGIPDSGEIWYLLDYRFQMKPTLIEKQVLTSSQLNGYNVIVMANGVPTLTESSKNALKEWVANGGTLIATGKAYQWVNDAGILSIKQKEPKQENDSTSYLSFEDKQTSRAGKSISGVILDCEIDRSHPIAWGLQQDKLAVMKTGNVIFQKDDDPYVAPLHYSSSPLISGFLSRENADLLKDSPAIIAKRYKNGKVIVFADDMNFRSYWFGTSKLFMNAVLFSSCID